MARRKIKTKIGDVFAIPIKEDLYGFGQKVDMDTFIIFEYVGSDPIAQVGQAFDSPILLLVHTVAVKIEDGEWLIIQNFPVRPDIVFPVYKMYVGTSDIYVINHNVEILRPATPDEVKNLKMKTSISPHTIDRLLKAKYADGEWKDYYDKHFYRP